MSPYRYRQCSPPVAPEEWKLFSVASEDEGSRRHPREEYIVLWQLGYRHSEQSLNRDSIDESPESDD